MSHVGAGIAIVQARQAGFGSLGIGEIEDLAAQRVHLSAAGDGGRWSWDGGAACAAAVNVVGDVLYEATGVADHQSCAAAAASAATKPVRPDIASAVGRGHAMKTSIRLGHPA